MSSKSQSGGHVSLRDTQEPSEIDVEQTRNWRKIIFIPHRMSWKILVVLSVLINIFIATYYLVFTNDALSLTINTPFYICEFIYVLDVTMAILHRCMASYRITRLYSPRHALLLVVDVISLFPYYELHYIMDQCTGGDESQSKDYMKMKVILRLQYAVVFYKSIRNHPGYNQVIVVIFGQLYIFALYVLFASCAWYLVRENADSVWIQHLSHSNFDSSKSINWFIICASIIGNAYMHSSAGVISVRSVWEYAIYTTTMLFGCLMHVMIFFGDLTAQHIQKYKHQLNYSHRLNIIVSMMKDWQTDAVAQKKTTEHYNKYWEMRQGMKRMPQIFWNLPLAMQKEVGLDLFWDCFMHSHFFLECEINFKRTICLSMRSEFFLPGDYLYCANQQKYKMAYLVSGIVQILSQEDQESPVLSFSSGTLFGEIATMMLVPSLINLRCATYCEIYTLNLRDLCNGMVQYKKSAKFLHEKLNNRLKQARLMQHPILLKMKDKQQKRTSIRWLKNQWRFIYHYSKKKVTTPQEIPATACHTSNYLNMYALSGDVELKEGVICLKATCPLVMEPQSSFRTFMVHLVAVVVVIQCIATPYFVFFNGDMSNESAGLFYMLDLIYLIGLYMDLSTAIKSKEVLITDPKDIIAHKTKQVTMIIDVIAICPIELIAYVLHSSRYTRMLLHLNRILKLHKVYTLEKTAEGRLLSKALRLRLIKFSVIFAFLVYFIGCFLYGIACPDLKCAKDSWYTYFRNATENNGIPKHLRSTDFMISISYAVSLLLGLTEYVVYDYSTLDTVFGLLTTFTGYCMFSFCFSELVACTAINLQDTNDFQEYQTVLKLLNTNSDIPQYLKKNMYDITMCEWNYSRRHPLSGEMGILNDAPENLKKTILYQRIVDCLLRVPLFQTCDKNILWNLAPLAQLNVVPPETIIGREDTYQKYLKVLLRGYCRVETSIPTDNYRGNYSIYTSGDVFPLMESLMDINTFLRVTSITFVEVACIPLHSIFSQIKNNDAELYRDLKITMLDFMRENDTILMRRKGRLPEMVSAMKSYGKGEYFDYETNEHFDDVERKAQNVELHKFKFYRRFFLKITLNPNKFIYVAWECARCTISVINFIYTVTVMKYFMATGADTYIQLVFLTIACMDCYIRLHCRYYNEKGIVVIHPWYTANYYICGAFILDLYSNFPYNLVGLESMFHGHIRVRLPVLLMVLSRPVQLYRLYYGLEYIQSISKENKAVLIERINYVIIIAVIFLTCSALLEQLTCVYVLDDGIKYVCGRNSWIMSSAFGKNITQRGMMVISYYKVLSLFSTCGLGLFRFATFWESIEELFLAFVLFAVKWFSLAKIISSAIKGNTKLTEYQRNAKLMVKFLQNYLVAEALTKEAVDHYENIFNRSQGYDVNVILRNFFCVLCAEFTFSMYWPILKTSDLFSSSNDTDMHNLCAQFILKYYKKDAMIIRCNDVQEYCYVVYKGKVKISIAGTNLRILNAGGAFGCFQVGRTRQTITATALVHAEVLCIKSRLLNEMSQRSPLLRDKLKKAHYLNTEYMDSTYEYESGDGGIIEDVVNSKTWRRFIINPEKTWYLLFNYIICVHLATLTSMAVVIVVARMDVENSYYFYIVDAIFILKIVMGFRLAYVDHETGILVQDSKKIAKKYLTDWKGFWYDLLTCIPFELIALAITSNRVVYTCCWMNRSLRFLHLVIHYNICKNKLTVSTTLKWTYLMYMMLLVIHFMSTVWWLIACPKDVCTFLTESRGDSDLEKSTDFLINFRITYMYVVSIFSSTGVRNQVPQTITEIMISVLIIIISQFMLYTLTSGFANILCLGKHVLNNYERVIEHVNIFLKNSKVSLPLINKIRNYFLMLWLHYGGTCMPSLIAEAPDYLKQDIMFALYGYHITNHMLFAKTHVDFIRQLIVHMDPKVYLPGQYIIEKGDIDSRMYFIHQGEVKVYDRHGNNEIEQCVLKTGMSFGEYQALMQGEHIRSVKTSRMCVIISLKTTDWNYLLDWFPASKEMLEARLANLSPIYTASAAT